MTGYLDFITEFVHRFFAVLGDPELKLSMPQYKAEGVQWVAVIPPSMAITIVEKKDGATAMSLMYREGAEKKEHKFLSTEHKKLEHLIGAVLTRLKEISPFMEVKEVGKSVSCRSYKDIFNDLAEEYIKTTPEFKDKVASFLNDQRKLGELKDYLKKTARAKTWTDFKSRLFQIIRDSKKIDPIRKTGENGGSTTYGVTYDGDTIDKKHVQIYIKFIEKPGADVVMQWGEDSIVCHDPRLREMAEAAMTAFKCRVKLPEQYALPLSNFISAYCRQRQLTQNAAANAAGNAKQTVH